MLFSNDKRESQQAERQCKKTNSQDSTKHGGRFGNADDFHLADKKELLGLLAETGEALPEGGEMVLDLFVTLEGHVSPDYIKNLLHQQGINVAEDTINKSLELLCRYGIAQKAFLNGKGPWYEHLHLGADHDHLMCVKCGKVVEFPADDLKAKGRQTAAEYGFEPIHQKTTIYGLCPECRRRQEPLMPLAMAATGEKVKVSRITGGHSMKNRLSAMGLTTGDTIEIINNAGPFIINAKGSRLALGKGLAQKILVSPVK